MKAKLFVLVVSVFLLQPTFQQNYKKSVGQRLRYLESIINLQTKNINALTRETKDLKNENKNLKEEIGGLKNRTSYLENIAANYATDDVLTTENEVILVNENGMIPTVGYLNNELTKTSETDCPDTSASLKQLKNEVMSLNENFMELNTSFTSLNQKVMSCETSITKSDIKSNKTNSVTDSALKCFTKGSYNISLPTGDYDFFVMGGGAPGCNGHNPGGSAGFFRWGKISHISGKLVDIEVGSGGRASRSAPRIPYDNSQKCVAQGKSSSFYFNGLDGNNIRRFDVIGYGGKINKESDYKYDHRGSSGGGGSGNQGLGGQGGSHGHNGDHGETVNGGYGMLNWSTGEPEFEKAMNFLEDKLRRTYPNAWVGAGIGGHASEGSHAGGGGAGGISIKNVPELSTPTAGNGVYRSFKPGYGGFGFGAGGGAGGYDSNVFQDGGDGAPGFVCIFDQ